MKPSSKWMLLVLAGVLTAEAVSAQSLGRYVAVGPIGGIVFSDRGGGAEEFAENETRTGFTAGGFLEYGFSRNLAMEAQLLYIRKGAADGASSELRLSYLEVPVLVSLRLPAKTGGGVSPFFQAGPAVAFLQECALTVSGFSSPCSEDETHSTEVGAIVGVGVDLGPLRVGARYELGFTRLSTYRPESNKNRAVVLLAGLRFRFAR